MIRRHKPPVHGARAIILPVLLLILAISPAVGAGDDSSRSDKMLSKSLLAAQSDVEQAAAMLNDIRDKVASKRTPLSRKLADLEKEAAELRSQVRRIRLAQRQQEQSFDALRQSLLLLEDDTRFIHTVLSEYRRSLETRASVAEARALQETLLSVDAALSDKAGCTGLPAAAEELLDLAFRWNSDRLGGTSFSGVCLNPRGVAVEGHFVVLGPAVYFNAAKEELAGMAITRMGSALPSVLPGFTPLQRSALSEVLSGRSAPLPVDVTAGDAIKVSGARQSLLGQIGDGGFVMIPILAIGLFAIVLTALKIVQLARVRTQDPENIRRVIAQIRKDDIDSALQAARTSGPPLSDIISDGIEHRAAPREHIEEILHEHLLGYIPHLEKHLGTLAVLGGVAPLLGLLGTVTGMIHTFQLVRIFGTGDAKLLSGGISEALVTTEFGLIIAIPVLLIHAFLSRRVRTLIGALERTVVHFVNELVIKRAS